MDSGFNRGTVFLSTVLVAVLCWIGSGVSAVAEELQQAKVTQVVNDVKLLPNQAAPRPAVVNDEVKQGTAVRTGNESRTELTFKDLTITRLGANTVFSFKAGTRDLKLTNGAVLIQVPPGAPEVKVSTSAVSAAISGGTAIFDASTGKFMVLEGEGWIWPTGHPEQKVIVHAGEMVWLTAGGKISAPEKFDVKLVLETSLLITDFAPLANLDLILQVIDAQQADTAPTPGPTPQKTNEDIISQRTDASPSPTPTPEGSTTPTPTPETPTPTPATPTPTPATPTPTPATPTPTPATPTPTPATPTPTPSTPTPTPATPTPTPATPTPTPATPTPTPATPTPTPATPTPTPATPTPTPATPTPTPATPTPTPATPTPTPATPTPTPATPTPTPATPTPTPATPTPTPATPTPTPATPTPTPATPTPTPATPTPTPATPTPTPATPTPTPATPTPTPATPTPTPSSTGTPSVISSPHPYVIDSTSVIHTDPTIETGGNTDFGKIYRGPTADGPFTQWAFGSTSPFDDALNLDTEFFSDTGAVPISVFKFQSLVIAGNPTIDTTNGPTKLGLIGVDGITTGPPGGTLTFSGLDTLFLATVNGPINLTSDVSFDGIPSLAIYARGAGSNLTINSPISNVTNLDMAAEGSVQLNNAGTMIVGRIGGTAGVNFNLQVGSLQLNGGLEVETINLPGTMLASGGNVTVNVTNDLTNSSTTDFSQLRVKNSGAHIGTGGNVSLTSGGNIVTGAGGVNLSIENTAGDIQTGGNISLMTGGSFSSQGQLAILLQNYDFSANPAGHIGNGGNISVTTNGDLSADSMNAVLNNRAGGMIDSGVSLTLNVGGALTTANDAPDTFGLPESLLLAISNRYDDSAGITANSLIGGDTTLSVNADSISIGGRSTAIISNRGGTIDGSALVSFNVTNDLIAQGVADFEILNDGGAVALTPRAGILHGAATVQFTGNNFTANGLDAVIANKNGGLIDSNATISFVLNGNLSVPGTNPTDPEFDVTGPGEADFTIQNHRNPSETTGGSIGGNAQISLTAASITTADLLAAEIENHNGGQIGENAAISINLTGNLTTGNSLTLQIWNYGPGGESAAGQIGGNAQIVVSADNISVPENATLLGQILNQNGGQIGGMAQISLIAADTIDAGNLDLHINNIGGMIGGNAQVDVTADRTFVAGDLSLKIDNSANAGSIGGDAIVSLNGGDMSAAAVSAIIDNKASTIVGNATINLGGLNIGADSLFVQIDSSNDGFIGGFATINSNITGDVTVTGDITYEIDLTPTPTPPPSLTPTSVDADTLPTNAINFEGGFYEADGTFRATINGGDGMISFNNAFIRADVIKVGVFGDTGVLKIGGTFMTADTILRLYAPGSNGMIDFVANCTLTSNGMAIVLAANTVTIEDDVTVRINGSAGAALVYTNHPNYDEASGGNGSTTGMFIGNGATTHPLSDAPDFETGATPTPAPTPSKFGTPSTIQTPAPYVINSGTTISTDPVIMTNGQTDYGKIYRGDSEGGDGPLATWAFGTVPSDFDSAIGFGSNPDPDFENAAVFKFQSLELDDQPAISTEGGVTRLGLIGVDGITSGGDGGTFTFSGLDFVFLATEDGAINLGATLTFQNMNRLYLYARGANGNMTLGSQFDSIATLNLNAEGSLQVNGTMTNLGNFNAFVGTDFLTGTGHVTSGNISITSLGDINFAASQFTSTGNQFILQATGTLNIDASGADTSVFSNPTIFSASGATINISADAGTILNFNPSATSTFFSAGSGGIQASNIIFNAQNLLMSSSGDINVYGINAGGFLQGTVTADGSFTSVSNVTTGTLTTNSGNIVVGGNLFVSSVNSAGTIDVTGRLSGFDSANANGGVTANQVAIPNINDPTGVLTVGSGGIVPFIIIFGPGDGSSYQHTFNVDSIVSPNGINFNGNQFDLTTDKGPGGRLTINADSLTFDSATGIGNVNFDGADNGAFGGSQVNGGDGGIFVANAVNNISASNGTDISATTGGNATSADFGGTGGSVTLHSTEGMVTLDNTIIVSSDESEGSHHSLNGGSIVIQSDLASGTGINIGGDAQLLSLLNANSPGSGGSILVVTQGSDINIASGARIEADRGTIAISNSSGPSFSQINIDGATLSSGTLNISSNGTINVGSSNPVSVTAATINVFTTGILNWVTPLSLPNIIQSDSSGNVQFIADNIMFFGGDVDITRIGSSSPTNDGFGVFFGGGTLTFGGHLSISLTAGPIDFGGNIGLNAQHNISVSGPMSLGIHVVSDITDSGVDSATIRLLNFGSLMAQNIQANVTVDPGKAVTTGGNVSIFSTLGITTTGSDISDGISLGINTSGGGGIVDGGNISVGSNGSISTQGDIDLTINNSSGGTLANGVAISVNAASVTANSVNALINNQNGGVIGNSSTFGDATIQFNLTGDLTTTQGGVSLQIWKQTDTSAGAIWGDAVVSASAANISSAGSFLASFYNNFVGSQTHGDATITISTGDFSVGNPLSPANATVEITNIFATIGGDASISVQPTGTLDVRGDALFQILNGQIDSGSAGGVINENASVNISANDVFVSGGLTAQVDNTASLVNFSATVGFSSTNDIVAQGDAVFQIQNSDTFGTTGTIGNDAGISVSAGQEFEVNSLTMLINDRNGGTIGDSAALSLNVGDAITTTDFLRMVISTRPNDIDGEAGLIGLNGTISLMADSVDVGSDFTTVVSTNGGGTIGLAASVTLNVNGTLSASTATIHIENSYFPAGDTFFPGGTIGTSATLDVTAGHLSIGDFLDVAIWDHAGGSIGTNAVITMNVDGDLGVTNDANIYISNIGTDTSQGPGTIGDDATITVNAGSVTVGGNYDNTIYNNLGGTIGLAASITNVVGDMNVTGDILYRILNNGDVENDIAGGVIGTTASISVSAANITGNSLLAQIDSTQGGSIGGDASIAFNISPTGTVTTTGNATFEIARPPVPAIATSVESTEPPVDSITFNGGSYEVGGTFRATITGSDGTAMSPIPITFTNASIHADVIKVGVFGTNGILKIGGGVFTADTTLKLYAPGSNGVIEFVADVTLGGNAVEKIIAANTVKIDNDVTVTISGSALDVYTNHSHFALSSGGDGTTSGAFVGTVNLHPLDGSTPTFDDSFSASTTAGTSAKAGTASGTTSSSTTVSASPTPSTTSLTSASTPTKKHPTKDSTFRQVATDSTHSSGTPVRIGVRVADTDELANLVADTAPGSSKSDDAVRATKRDGSRRRNKDSDRRIRRDLDTRDKVSTRTDMNRLPTR